MRAVTVQVSRRGTTTLPLELRVRYHVGEGNLFTLIELGEGNFLLTPRVSRLARLGDAAARELAQEKVSLEELLDAPHREREPHDREHYQGATAASLP